MAAIKKISILSITLFAACQQAAAPIVVYDTPASDAAEELDFSKLPDGFPVIAEMSISVPPKSCGLQKAEKNSNASYIFVSDGDDKFNVGINGVVRQFKPTKTADMGAKKVRFFKTIEGPEVEVMVVLEPEGSRDKSMIGRVKAWDQDLPLLCAYNRIEVEGDCDL